MGQVSAYLRRAEGGYSHWCPGCDEMHMIPDSWTFNRDLNKPTFSPSVKITGRQKITEEEYARLMRGEKIDHIPFCCHYFVTDGQINFCSDCTHALSGKSVPLPALPREWCDETPG